MTRTVRVCSCRERWMRGQSSEPRIPEVGVRIPMRMSEEADM